MKKDLLNISDLEVPDFDTLWQKTRRLKKSLKDGKPHGSLQGKTLGMIFDKSSTRTRISFEVGMYQLG
ncbi:MAG: ornithine carbamoyltransferase, partial [Syntrophaceae bacterium]|nr:ornithine carbamoyltransferase [Syntrophaceae bacterium]